MEVPIYEVSNYAGRWCASPVRDLNAPSNKTFWMDAMVIEDVLIQTEINKATIAPVFA
jgi:hypothetical protein